MTDVAFELGAPDQGHFVGFIPDEIGEHASDETQLTEVPCRLEVFDALVRLDVGVGSSEAVVLAKLDDLETAIKQAKGKR